MNNPVRILVVEDTLIAQVVLKTQLTQLGCEVDLASDGIIALDKAQKNPYDLILMDIGLGEGPDGFDVTLSIKNKSKINKDTPIMAVTAHGEPEYEEKAHACGMLGYFKKPFTAADAKIILERLENNKRK